MSSTTARRNPEQSKVRIVRKQNAELRGERRNGGAEPLKTTNHS